MANGPFTEAEFHAVFATHDIWDTPLVVGFFFGENSNGQSLLKRSTAYHPFKTNSMGISRNMQRIKDKILGHLTIWLLLQGQAFYCGWCCLVPSTYQINLQIFFHNSKISYFHLVLLLFLYMSSFCCICRYENRSDETSCSFHLLKRLA